jgi:hypothetical protein
MAETRCPHCETELFRDTVLAGGRCPGCMRNLPEGFAVDQLPSVSPAKPRPRPAGAAPVPGGAWYPMRSGLALLRWGLSLFWAFCGLAVLLLLWLLRGADPRALLPVASLLGPQLMLLLPANLITVLLLTAMATPYLLMLALLAALNYDTPAALLLLLAAPCGVTAVVLLLAGVVRCCTPPSRVGARPWAAGSLGSLLASFILWGVAMTLSVRLRQEETPNPDEVRWLLGVAGALAVVSLVFLACFFLLLRASARHFGGKALGAAFVYYLFTMLFVPAAGVGLYVTLVAAGADPGAPWVAPAVGVVELVFNLAMFAWLMYLLGRLRRLITAG